ncbi:TIGR03808 family TAT-translocated repetitive protein [Mesorhizobium sp. 1B3]|uniref:TIGR03808 family TAT-translocated repetitive protein n=1 Tax=Mesorhizobium sp. 1B3 TaxID=3243599 RepID=UPI003D9796FF
MLNRRGLLFGATGFSVLAPTIPSAVLASPMSQSGTASRRGAVDATTFGIRPGAFDDQSRAFSRMLQSASDTGTPVFLPPGIYVVSGLSLPRRVWLSGVPGATRIIYGGDKHMILADDADRIELSGIVFDGASRWIDEPLQGLLHFRRVRELVMESCDVVGSGRSGIALERVGGRIEHCTVSRAADAGIYSIDATRLNISGNRISDCANGGILVHRWQTGDDGTMVTGNRVERILARNGGTGQFGNGINAFRADNVMISNNSILDCAFSAVRANSSSNIQIVGNSATRSGETAIYAEFAFEGAVINANLVDRAANGISIVNFNEGGRLASCSGNVVRNLSAKGPYTPAPPGFGIGIAVEADCAATGNVVENASLYGMMIGWGEFMRNVVATGNVIRQAPTGIAVSVAQGVGSAVITDNLIEGASNGAIVGFEWTRSVTGDLSKDGVGGYTQLTVDRNRAS